METKEYFREDKSSHIKLPLRWLAPESMDDYVFSEKSDVVSSGSLVYSYYYSVNFKPYNIIAKFCMELLKFILKYKILTLLQ